MIAASDRTREPVAGWRILVTAVMVMVQYGLALVTGLIWFAAEMSTDACAYKDCDLQALGEANHVAGIGTAVIVLSCTFASVVMLIRGHRSACWIPAAGLITQSVLICWYWVALQGTT